MFISSGFILKKKNSERFVRRGKEACSSLRGSVLWECEKRTRMPKRSFRTHTCPCACARAHTPAHTQRRYTSCKEKVGRLTAGLRTCFHDDQPLAGARPSVRAGSGSHHLPGTGSGAQPRLITRAKLGLRRDCRHLPASLAASLH